MICRGSGLSLGPPARGGQEGATCHPGTLYAALHRGETLPACLQRPRPHIPCWLRVCLVS